MKFGKFLKSTAILLSLSFIYAILCACGDTQANVPTQDIAAAVDEALGKADSLTAVDANYIKGYMKMETTDYEQCIVKINAYGANIDEYGIIKAKDGAQAKEVKAMVESYLQLRQASWMDEYMPEEKPKLTNAEVKANGNYVMYCILGDADKQIAFDAFSAALK